MAQLMNGNMSLGNRIIDRIISCIYFLVPDLAGVFCSFIFLQKSQAHVTVH